MARKYSKEFKQDVCGLVLKEGIKLAVVAERIGVHKVMLYRWIEEYQTYGDEAFVGKGRLRAGDASLKKLQRENERLKQENEILKKAAAYFAKAHGNE